MLSTLQVRILASPALLDNTRIDTRQGTTGRPKGVDVSHRNVTNLVCVNPGNLGIEKETPVAQLLSISFDMGKFMASLVCNFGSFCTAPSASGAQRR
jgi:non-ribosomal peptide synthetase component F